MLIKIIHFLLIILLFSLPLINSHLLDIFYLEKIGSYFYLDGNYEFFKVLFFNIFSGFIIFLFFIGTIFQTPPPSVTPFKKVSKLIFPKIIFYIIGVLLLSNIFSFTPFTSLLGNNSKGDSTLMFINMIGLFIVFINLLKNNENIKNIFLKTIIISSFFVSIIGIKEFLLPTFDYSDLSNRALSTFGHPNYLALYLLLIIPIINYKINNSQQRASALCKIIYGIILFFVIIGLFLTKSVWAIFLFFNYLIYLKYEDIKLSLSGILSLHTKRKRLQNICFFIIYFLIIISLISIVLSFYPEKLSSFISRFYIWETVLNIIFSDIKIFLFGNGLGNLNLIFESFKIPELYIFENFGFLADRPHNIFLYILYSFGVIGIGLFGYIIYGFYDKFIKNPPTPFHKGGYEIFYIEIIILFLLFNIFNFSSIASYLIIILVISIIYNKEPPTPLIKGNEKYKLPLIRGLRGYSLFFITTSLFSIYFYSKYFIEEHKVYNNYHYETNNIFIKEIDLENKEKTIFKKYYDNSKILCNKLILNSPSAENYIYCGNLLYYLNKELSIKYYNLGLKKLPDLWNKNSKYYDNIFINKENLQHRFFSEKYGNINIVLERVGIKK